MTIKNLHDGIIAESKIRKIEHIEKTEGIIFFEWILNENLFPEEMEDFEGKLKFYLTKLKNKAIQELEAL